MAHKQRKKHRRTNTTLDGGVGYNLHFACSMHKFRTTAQEYYKLPQWIRDSIRGTLPTRLKDLLDALRPTRHVWY